MSELFNLGLKEIFGLIQEKKTYRGEVFSNNTNRSYHYYQEYAKRVCGQDFNLSKALLDLSQKNQAWLDFGCGDADPLFQVVHEFPPNLPLYIYGITAKKTGRNPKFFSQNNHQVEIIEEEVKRANSLASVLVKNRIKDIGLFTAFNSIYYLEEKLAIQSLREIIDHLNPSGIALIQLSIEIQQLLTDPDDIRKHVYEKIVYSQPKNTTNVRMERTVRQILEESFPKSKFLLKQQRYLESPYQEMGLAVNHLTLFVKK